MPFTCRARGTEPHTHEDAEVGRQHYLADTWTCGWLYQVRDRYGVERDEDGQEVILECSGLAWELPNGRGHTCENGHEHINIETRVAERWDYAADAGEARLLAAAGTEPRDMELGRVWV
jgi:hypothetical protein